jgi:putative transposase
MLNFKKRLWIVKQKEKGNIKDREIADSQNVSRMTVNKIWRAYKNSGLETLREKTLGRKADEIQSTIKQAILDKRKLGYGIRKIEGLLNSDGISISHNKIHRFLQEENLIKPEPKKGKRRKYVRWERHHSNSLWQTDFCWQERLRCWIIAYLDDHSRFIVGIRYTKLATSEVAINLFDKSYKKYGLPREVLSDRGAQFYANIGGKSAYTTYLESLSVNHILASIKKPTTTGKMERFWLTHNIERWKFSSLQKFIQFYNFERPHMSLNYQTPYEVFTRDLKV